jgi:hypothetical protein
MWGVHRRTLYALLLAGCPKAAPSSTTAAPTSTAAAPGQVAEPMRPAQSKRLAKGDYGTAHPTFLRTFDRVSSRWMALCQARTDTDGDGKVEIFVGHHGELMGDDMQLYFIIDGGEGTQVDSIVDTSFDDRWVAIVRGSALELVDTQTRAMFELKDADIESDNRPGAAHRAARFSPEHVLYIRHRDKGDTLVIRDLASQAEREVTVSDRIWRFAEADRLVELYTIPHGSDFPRLSTTLGEGECLGPPMSWSTHGQSGPTPTPHWIDLDRAVEVKKPAAPLVERVHPRPVRVPEIVDDKGPARWK